MNRLTLMAGRLAYGKIRNIFLFVRSEGHDIRMEEGGGFLSRPFLFTGSREGLLRLHAYLSANFEWDGKA